VRFDSPVSTATVAIAPANTACEGFGQLPTGAESGFSESAERQSCAASVMP
jgi:hypothetical protein